MKKLAYAFMLAALTSCGALAATQEVFTFTTGNPGTPACSSTVKTGCTKGFTINDKTLGTVVANPASGSTSYSRAVPVFGTHSYSIVENLVDSAGNAVTSPEADASDTVQPNAPTGFSVTLQ